MPSNPKRTQTKILIALLVFPTMYMVARLILAFPVMLIFGTTTESAVDPRFLKIVDVFISLASVSTSVSVCRLVWPKVE